MEVPKPPFTLLGQPDWTVEEREARKGFNVVWNLSRVVEIYRWSCRAPVHFSGNEAHITFSIITFPQTIAVIDSVARDITLSYIGRAVVTKSRKIRCKRAEGYPIDLYPVREQDTKCPVLFLLIYAQQIYVSYYKELVFVIEALGHFEFLSTCFEKAKRYAMRIV